MAYPKLPRMPIDTSPKAQRVRGLEDEVTRLRVEVDFQKRIIESVSGDLNKARESLDGARKLLVEVTGLLNLYGGGKVRDLEARVKGFLKETSDGLSR